MCNGCGSVRTSPAPHAVVRQPRSGRLQTPRRSCGTRGGAGVGVCGVPCLRWVLKSARRLGVAVRRGSAVTAWGSQEFGGVAVSRVGWRRQWCVQSCLVPVAWCGSPSPGLVLGGLVGALGCVLPGAGLALAVLVLVGLVGPWPGFRAEVPSVVVGRSVGPKRGQVSGPGTDASGKAWTGQGAYDSACRRIDPTGIMDNDWRMAFWTRTPRSQGSASRDVHEVPPRLWRPLAVLVSRPRRRAWVLGRPPLDGNDETLTRRGRPKPCGATIIRG